MRLTSGARLGHADILEADMPQSERLDQVDYVEAIADGLVIAGQHENEIHAGLPYFRRAIWARRLSTPSAKEAEVKSAAQRTHEAPSSSWMSSR